MWRRKVKRHGPQADGAVLAGTDFGYREKVGPHSGWVSAGLGTVAVRMPENDLCA